MIDLHTHTNESDGTYTPAELLESALQTRLDALAICDHDTLTGYDQAAPLARAQSFDLVCGIELSTRLALNGGSGRSAHLLGYFLCTPPSPEFREWLDEMRRGRRERNVRLVERLNSMGVDIQLAEVEALGRSQTGRPHFAKLLIQKGYVDSIEAAFRDYLGESAPGYVERDSPSIAAAIERVIAGGGIPVLAHPVRLGLRDADREAGIIAAMRDDGLRGIEVYHSDHSPADVNRYLDLARKYGLAISGGSDFHGALKPNVSLGTGVRGNVNVPKQVLDQLRELCREA